MLNFMKRFFHKKYLFFLLALIIFFGPTLIVLADVEPERDKYRSRPKNTNEVMSKLGTSTIINRSDKDLFVPNNTSPEYQAFANNAPGYVSVSLCTDSVVSEGETTESCGQVSRSPKSYCGDGVCNVSSTTLVYTKLEPPRVEYVYDTVCAFELNKLPLIG